jgi:hypothetical protein
MPQPIPPLQRGQYAIWPIPVYIPERPLLADLEPCTPGRQTTVLEFEVDILWGIVLQNSRPGNH